MSKQNNFIKEIAPLITKYSKKYGYKVSSVTIAQACIESGFGNNWSRKYSNYFGIKYGSWVKRTTIADKISVVQAKTKEEYKAGTLTTIIDGFCKCPDMETGVILYFEFLRVNPRYSNLKSCMTAQSMAQTLKADGYATSSSYVSTLMQCVNMYGLTSYDSNEIGKGVEPYAAKVAVNSSLNVRTGAGEKAPMFTISGNQFRLPPGMIVTIEQECGGWGKLASINGWVSLNWVKKV